MVSDRRFPSLSAIRAFEAAARLGSFAKAAQELDTSAASVSYQVRRLDFFLDSEWADLELVSPVAQWLSLDALDYAAAGGFHFSGMFQQNLS